MLGQQQRSWEGHEEKSWASVLWTEVSLASLGQLTCEDYGESGKAFSSMVHKELWGGGEKSQSSQSKALNTSATFCLTVIVWQA